MKYFVSLLFVIFSLNCVSQESVEQQEFLDLNTEKTSEEVEAFAPNRKLLNKDLWKRVSVNRFESGFLRLAVELKGFNYQLIEMDGGKRILIETEKYALISNAIVKLTLRSTPNLSGRTSAASGSL